MRAISCGKMPNQLSRCTVVMPTSIAAHISGILPYRNHTLSKPSSERMLLNVKNKWRFHGRKKFVKINYY